VVSEQVRRELHILRAELISLGFNLPAGIIDKSFLLGDIKVNGGKSLFVLS